MGTLLYVIVIGTSLSHVANSLNERMLIICTLLSRTGREEKENNKRHLNVLQWNLVIMVTLGQPKIRGCKREVAAYRDASLWS